MRQLLHPSDAVIFESAFSAAEPGRLEGVRSSATVIALCALLCSVSASLCVRSAVSPRVHSGAERSLGVSDFCGCAAVPPAMVALRSLCLLALLAAAAAVVSAMPHDHNDAVRNDSQDAHRHSLSEPESGPWESRFSPNPDAALTQACVCVVCAIRSVKGRRDSSSRVRGRPRRQFRLGASHRQ